MTSKATNATTEMKLARMASIAAEAEFAIRLANELKLPLTAAANASYLLKLEIQKAAEGRDHTEESTAIFDLISTVDQQIARAGEIAKLLPRGRGPGDKEINEDSELTGFIAGPIETKGGAQ